MKVEGKQHGQPAVGAVEAGATELAVQAPVVAAPVAIEVGAGAKRIVEQGSSARAGAAARSVQGGPLFARTDAPSKVRDTVIGAFPPALREPMRTAIEQFAHPAGSWAPEAVALASIVLGMSKDQIFEMLRPRFETFAAHLAPRGYSAPLPAAGDVTKLPLAAFEEPVSAESFAAYARRYPAIHDAIMEGVDPVKPYADTAGMDTAFRVAHELGAEDVASELLRRALRTDNMDVCASMFRELGDERGQIHAAMIALARGFRDDAGRPWIHYKYTWDAVDILRYVRGEAHGPLASKLLVGLAMYLGSPEYLATAEAPGIDLGYAFRALRASGALTKLQPDDPQRRAFTTYVTDPVVRQAILELAERALRVEGAGGRFEEEMLAAFRAADLPDGFRMALARRLETAEALMAKPERARAVLQDLVQLAVEAEDLGGLRLIDALARRHGPSLHPDGAPPFDVAALLDRARESVIEAKQARAAGGPPAPALGGRMSWRPQPQWEASFRAREQQMKDDLLRAERRPPEERRALRKEARALLAGDSAFQAAWKFAEAADRKGLREAAEKMIADGDGLNAVKPLWNLALLKA